MNDSQLPSHISLAKYQWNWLKSSYSLKSFSSVSLTDKELKLGAVVTVRLKLLCPSWHAKPLIWHYVVLFPDFHPYKDQMQHYLRENQLIKPRDAGWCRQEDGGYDSDHGVLISGNAVPEAGCKKTDGNMVRRFSREASHATRNPFMRWLSGCNATNLGLMKSTGAGHQRGGLLAIYKRISERARCAVRWNWFNCAQPRWGFLKDILSHYI